MKLLLSYLLLLCTSCSIYKMYDGNSRTVKFIADSTVFAEPNTSRYPKLSYPDVSYLTGVNVSSIDLVLDKEVEVIIAHPTLFVGNGNFLIFPRDRLSVTKNLLGRFDLKSLNKKNRTRELAAFSIFNEIAPPPPSVLNRNISVDSIIAIENRIKENILELTKEAIFKFDSLRNIYKTSRHFNEVTKDYAKSKYVYSLFRLYSENKDSLLAKNMYHQKCTELLPLFNSVATTLEIEYNLSNINEFANAILQHNITKIKNLEEFQNDFDSVETNFKGLLREYLLSRILYSSYTNHLPIPGNYIEKYKKLGNTGYYQKILSKIMSDQSFTIQTIKSKGNYLYSMNKKEITSLENIMSNNKGKIIFLDFMASWCLPCREDLPFIKELEKVYSKSNIIFINLSLDLQYQPWKKYIYTSRLQKDNSFMFTNAKESPFLSQYKIEAIPRYLIFDKTGALVDQNAPRPNDRKLKILLDSLLLNSEK